MAKSSSKTTTKESKKAKVAPRAASPAESTSSRSNAGASSSSSDSDSDSSASDRSSKSPEPIVPTARRIDPLTTKYTPPAGFKASKESGDKSEIDWDAINADPELQLWAVRVPSGLKAKHLDKMVIQLPDASIQTPLQPVATFTASKSEYNAYLSTPSTSASAGNKRKAESTEQDQEEEDKEVEKSEMDNMLPLLPKKSAGNKLFQAPRPISKTLTIRRALPVALANLPSAASFTHSTLIASQPSPVPGAILSADELLDAKAIAAKKTQRSQPSGLKFRLELGGMKAKGGEGKFDNGVVLEPREVIRRVEEPAREQDQEMNDIAGSEGAVAVEDDDEEKQRQKEEKKAKKEKKRKEKEEGGGEGKSPKKKKVKTEA
ncbi:uncharacterized protein JCM6883_002809 [Sporobolomyces salmoneus]|uniref:uncharacterized protein n=1 Tax=Sporobolomyces salmoneus TaxID=183962 RepID=UPI00318088CE